MAQEFSCNFCKIFKNTFFTEHLWMTTYILQQLQALYFAIIYSWQLSNSEKSMVGKKNNPYIPRILQIYIFFFFSFFFFFIFFFHFLLQMPVYLFSHAKRMLYSEQPLLAWRHLNTMILTNFQNLNSISNIFQEMHNFLVLTDPVIICIYLRTTGRHFRDQGNIRHPTS